MKLIRMARESNRHTGRLLPPFMSISEFSIGRFSGSMMSIGALHAWIRHGGVKTNLYAFKAIC